ncbi:MAG: hypothetical protein K0R66_1102 [Gammaproteobacteria bacterium]|jgi:hypothetical protein|nr:hypothetical protein [Gammaproteobacteria bacterium]
MNANDRNLSTTTDSNFILKLIQNSYLTLDTGALVEQNKNSLDSENINHNHNLNLTPEILARLLRPGVNYNIRRWVDSLTPEQIARLLRPGANLLLNHDATATPWFSAVVDGQQAQAADLAPGTE